MIKEITDRSEWDKFVNDSGGHPLQLWGWGEVKANTGSWTAHRLLIDGQGGAQVLIRQLPRPFRAMAYIPRGPIAPEQGSRQTILDEVAKWAREQGCIELKIEPDWQEKTGLNDWRKSKNPILVSDTMRLDLGGSMDELLAEMKPDVRKNIRRSERDGVTIRRAESRDIDQMLVIYREIADRANFQLHSDQYYQSIAFFLGEACHLWLAEADGQPVAFQLAIATSTTSFALYGGANATGNQLRANYALQAAVIRDEMERGIRYYDMNGLLEGGVGDFKQRFGSQATHFVGAYDKPLSPLYGLWETAIPFGKKIVRHQSK